MSDPTDRWPLCFRCLVPIPPGEHVILSDPRGDRQETAHPRCTRAGHAEMAAIRAEACRQGNHEYPGHWTTDPADPYGDAAMWACARGCGYVRRHPGYGTNRYLAAAEGALLPVVPHAA